MEKTSERVEKRKQRYRKIRSQKEKGEQSCLPGKCELERFRFANVSLQDDHKYEVFKTATEWSKPIKNLLVNSA